MKKREVKEIEKEKEKSRIERENHFKKPKKKGKKSDNRYRWADLGSIQGAAHHQPCTQMHVREGQGQR